MTREQPTDDRVTEDEISVLLYTTQYNQDGTPEHVTIALKPKLGETVVQLAQRGLSSRPPFDPEGSIERAHMDRMEIRLIAKTRPRIL